MQALVKMMQSGEQGKLWKSNVKWELLIHNKNKEEIGVIGSTAATRWYRFLSPWDGGSSPLSPPNNHSDWFSEIIHNQLRLFMSFGPWGSSDIVHTYIFKFNINTSNLFVRIGCYIAGWSSWLARWPHEPKVVGPSPTPATQFIANKHFDYCFFIGEKISYIASCLWRWGATTGR